jgi:hypothetical protein
LLWQDLEKVQKNPSVIQEELGASKGDEGIKAEGKVRTPLPLPDGGVQQLENGTCIYDNRASDLSKEEQEEQEEPN